MSGSRLRNVSKRLPHRHLLCDVELIKTACFARLDQTVQGGLESVQGHIQPAALHALRCWWIPEFHASILFESVFDGDSFSQ